VDPGFRPADERRGVTEGGGSGDGYGNMNVSGDPWRATEQQLGGGGAGNMGDGGALVMRSV